MRNCIVKDHSIRKVRTTALEDLGLRVPVCGRNGGAPEHMTQRKARELLLSSCKAAAESPLRRESNRGWGREGTYRQNFQLS